MSTNQEIVYNALKDSVGHFVNVTFEHVSKWADDENSTPGDSEALRMMTTIYEGGTALAVCMRKAVTDEMITLDQGKEIHEALKVCVGFAQSVLESTNATPQNKTIH